MDDLSSPGPILDEQSEKVSVLTIPSENKEKMSNTHAPKQPILNECPARKFGNETFV
jgi:hypothetical protein